MKFRHLVSFTPAGIEFWRVQGRTAQRVTVLPYERGPLGAYQTLVGSPLWAECRRAAEAWTRQGVAPRAVA